MSNQRRFLTIFVIYYSLAIFYQHFQNGRMLASGASLIGTAPSSSPKLRYSKSKLNDGGPGGGVDDWHQSSSSSRLKNNPTSTTTTDDHSASSGSVILIGNINSAVHLPPQIFVPSDETSSTKLPSPARQTVIHNTAEYDLRQHLMSNYRMVRPVQRASDSLRVMSRLFPIKIQELVEKEERLVLSVRVQLGWIDQTMSWDPAAFYNQTSVVLPYDVKIWLPELQIVNSALDMYGIFSMRDRRSPVKAHSNGEVWWHPTGRMDVRCELQLMYFPFDFQKCGIVFEPVIYTQDQLNLTLRPDRSPVALSMYSENGLWDLVKTGGRQEIYWVSTATGFSRVEFVLYLQRRTTYYKMNIIFPCLLLSVLQLLTFILPIDNDERVPQATTILLSVIVFQTVIVDQLPKSSTSMSLLAMYISTLVGISTATVASSIICSLFISLRPSCFQVPSIFESIVKRCVTRLPPGILSAKGDPERLLISLRRRKSNLRRRLSTTAGNWPPSSPAPGKNENNNLFNNSCSNHNCSSKTAALIHHQQSLDLDDINESGWNQTLIKSQSFKQQPIQYHGQHNTRGQHNKNNEQTAAKLAPGSVFAFHERNEYSPAPGRQHQNPPSSQITANHNVIVTAASSGDVKTVTTSAPSASCENNCQPPKPPYVLVIDWCRMSHIINAAMFTLCLCLDVLVPSVLFYVMPPVNPPTD